MIRNVEVVVHSLSLSLFLSDLCTTANSGAQAGKKEKELVFQKTK